MSTSTVLSELPLGQMSSEPLLTLLVAVFLLA